MTLAKKSAAVFSPFFQRPDPEFTGGNGLDYFLFLLLG
jgi:hypothetical protein